jgi:transposase
MNNFRTIDRETGFLLPPSVDEWLPEKHLARFVVEVIDGMDLRAMSGSYRGSGSASYHPRMGRAAHPQNRGQFRWDRKVSPL